MQLLFGIAFAVAGIVEPLLAAPTPNVPREAHPYCLPGQVPSFGFGFASLKAQLGPLMGEPVECEHRGGRDGDALQRTTTGLAFWREATNVPTFTDGERHWGLTPAGMVYWEGSSIDPPGMAAPPEAATEPRVEAVVSRVVDGSSLDAHIAGNRTAVGYLGVETPAPNRPCGREALERNRELAGSRVLLADDPAHQFDEIGRRLYYAYTEDGRSIDEILVREGLGRAVRVDAGRGPALAAAQAEAEAAGRGCLWGGS